MPIDLAAANLTAADRDKFKTQGVSLPDGSFPIPSVLFLRKAIQSFGRVRPDDRNRLVEHIRQSADRLHADGLLWVKNFLAAHGGDAEDNIPAKKAM
jgi:hypothetical protein